MIFGLIDYLKSDVILTRLLGASGSDSKFYPVQAPIGSQDKTPYIIYQINNEGGFDEHLLDNSISFIAVSNIKTDIKAINDRVRLLLDLEDKIRKAVPDGRYNYLYGKNISSIDFVDGDNHLFHNVGIYDFRYQRNDFLLAEDDSFILTEDGGRIILEP